MEEYLLEMTGICKQFPGVRALDRVNFRVKKGSVHALMGENGAGKSTLMKCLFGVYKEDEGTIKISGREVRYKNPKQALENGVAMVHQELNQVLQRDIMDNMWLGRFPANAGIIDRKKMYNDTKTIFSQLDIKIDPKVKMGKLSVSERQMVEIAKAVSYGAKILVLDEPTSSLTEKETEHLFDIIKKLKEDGCGIIYISHKMEEILNISDEVTIMRDGRWITTESAENLTTEKIIKLMVGRELSKRFPERKNTPAEVIFKAENLSSKYPPKVNDVSFSLRKGEILGIAGLVGSRRTELLELIFGIRKIESGKMFLHGKEIYNKNCAEAIKNGFALLTEERRATGIFSGLDITFNSTIANLKKYAPAGVLNGRKMNSDTDWVIEKIKVKTPSKKTFIKTLSGGNQQKVLLGRWLLTTPEILLLDEPTRGIDVGAKYEIYQLIGEMAAMGKGVIVISSEMSELLGICDRIMVMSGGRVAAIDETKNLTQEKIMEYAAMYV